MCRYSESTDIEVYGAGFAVESLAGVGRGEGGLRIQGG